jgi:hypothetical protein
MDSFLDKTNNENDDDLLAKFEINRLNKNKKREIKKKASLTADFQLKEASDSICNDQILNNNNGHEIFINDNFDPNENDDVNMSIGSGGNSQNNQNLNVDKFIDDSLESNIFDTSSSDEENINDEQESPLLFKDSRLNVRNFNLLFMATMDKISIPEDTRHLVLDLIRFALPILNELPLSYHMVKKSIEKPEISSFLLCKICNQEISSTRYNDSEEVKKKYKKNKRLRKCLNEDCGSSNMGLKSRSFVKVFSLNIFSQLKIILEANENLMLKYIGKTLIFTRILFFLYLFV